MKWSYNPNPWRRRFAILPVCVDGQCIWLGWYWFRWDAGCREVSFTEPQS